MSTPLSPEFNPQDELQRLERQANRGLWVLLTFFAMSLGALNDFSFLPSMPEAFIQFLGPPPSTSLINGGLVLYVFSALMLTLARMTSGSPQYTGFGHCGYLAGFYAFYHFANALGDNFWAIFAAGVTVITLESYHMWTLSQEAIEKLRTEYGLAVQSKNKRWSHRK